MTLEASTPIKPPLFENIPAQLAERPQWVTWRREVRDGTPTKVPYTPGTLRRASPTDLMTWRPFEVAVAAYERAEPPYDGIGFVFSSGDPFVAIDFDDCRNPETGELTRWAQDAINTVQEGYIEVSPSGCGLHVIVVGTLRGGAVKTKHIEMYDRQRFFTISGVTL
jgi:putative DNA primase/helicase